MNKRKLDQKEGSGRAKIPSTVPANVACM